MRSSIRIRRMPTIAAGPTRPMPSPIRPLTDYVPIWDSVEEREPLDRLRHALDEFRQTKLQLLATDSSLGRAEIIEAPAHAPDSQARRGDPSLGGGPGRQPRRLRSVPIGHYLRVQPPTSGASGGASVWRSRAAWPSRCSPFCTSVASKRRLERQRLDEELSARELQQLSSRLITVQEEERRSIARELHDEVGPGPDGDQGRTGRRPEHDRRQPASTRISWKTSGRSPRARCSRSAICRTGCTRPSSTTSAWSKPSSGICASSAAVTTCGSKSLNVNMADRLAADIETSVYRIVQEALTNVAKHARATTCRLTLQRLANTVLVTLEDDGVGFDPAEREPDGPKPWPDRHPGAGHPVARHGAHRKRARKGHAVDGRTSGSFARTGGGRLDVRSGMPVENQVAARG